MASVKDFFQNDYPISATDPGGIGIPAEHSVARGVRHDEQRELARGGRGAERARRRRRDAVRGGAVGAHVAPGRAPPPPPPASRRVGPEPRFSAESRPRAGRRPARARPGRQPRVAAPPASRSAASASRRGVRGGRAASAGAGAPSPAGPEPPRPGAVGGERADGAEHQVRRDSHTRGAGKGRTEHTREKAEQTRRAVQVGLGARLFFCLKRLFLAPERRRRRAPRRDERVSRLLRERVAGRGLHVPQTAVQLGVQRDQDAAHLLRERRARVGDPG